MSPPKKCVCFTPAAQAMALMLMASAPLQAQPLPPEAVGQLKEVVVSASRSVQAIADLTVSMAVVGPDTLEAQQINDIRDVAKTLPNISVKRAPARFTVTGRGNPTGADGNAGFSIRGLGGNRVLMLVDGVRVPRSYINGSNAFGRDTVALGLVKQVELIRGPSSALYGSDGLAGLVNFITLAPADYLVTADGQAKDSGGKAWASYGGDDEGLTLGATLARRAGDRAEWSLTAVTERAHALDNWGSVDAPDTRRTTPNPQTSTGQSLLAKLVLRPVAGQTHTFSAEHVRKSSDVELLSSRAQTPTPLPLNYKSQSTTDKATALAASIVGESSDYTLARSRLTWDASYRLNTAVADRLTTVLSWQDSAALSDGQTRLQTLWPNDGRRLRRTSYDERSLQANVQAEKVWHLSADWGHKLTYGLDVAQTDVSSYADGSDPSPLPVFTPKKYFPDTRDTAQAIYLQSEWLSERWSITPGVRFDRFSIDVRSQDGYFPPAAAPGSSLSGSAVSPKLGVLWRATPQWSLYGNYATGFRAPEGQQVNSTLEASTAKLLANPDLKPEKSRTLEFGVKGRWDRLALDMALFTSRFDDLIQEKKNLGTANGLTASSANPTLFQTVNIDQASISGFEIQGQYHWGQVAGGQLCTPFSYGRARGTNDVTGLPLNSIDPATLSLGLSYRQPAWDVQLTLNHSEGKHVDDLDSPYVAANTTPRPPNPQFLPAATTTLDLHTQWRPRRGVRLNFAVINLTDRRYWAWSDVQGVASNATPLLVDAYTQPGRHVNLSLVMDF
ncbi:TonB-dependent hemoglobin/transferrin/lactoferrin family receptor [Rhodoferax sp. U2-2l]|uniref:TonB-dependent hemoglobin/transferrin/lactoferrin family receptor n=1 Tax=Rhodoferax sp. U2-2l TaxID=2884000 RepID=UPI001D0A5EAF|nr:TonB-dependent hemoglobin/transferrin/lactoferrin family receptor [Rhodoferax sp. U2-2l]MCB8747030.1 TonB-dependent hemoglobin/transferrin/lactoferrin family receptor [Rhodoferax sp. U2-2l]